MKERNTFSSLHANITRPFDKVSQISLEETRIATVSLFSEIGNDFLDRESLQALLVSSRFGSSSLRCSSFSFWLKKKGNK